MKGEMNTLKPTKGVKPHMEGVPGAFVTATEMPANIVWGAKLRISPYDSKLKELLDQGPNAVLCFGDTRARASLYARSKKLGMKLEYGEHAGKLYVRLSRDRTASPELTVRGTVVADQKTRNRANILSAMRDGKRTPEAMAAWMRDQGMSNLDAPIVRSMLQVMKADGTVKQTKITPETWESAV